MPTHKKGPPAWQALPGRVAKLRGGHWEGGETRGLSNGHQRLVLNSLSAVSSSTWICCPWVGHGLDSLVNVAQLARKIAHARSVQLVYYFYARHTTTTQALLPAGTPCCCNSTPTPQLHSPTPAAAGSQPNSIGCACWTTDCALSPLQQQQHAMLYPHGAVSKQFLRLQLAAAVLHWAADHAQPAPLLQNLLCTCQCILCTTGHREGRRRSDGRLPARTGLNSRWRPRLSCCR